MQKRVNYLNNRELLKEINLSKATYCYFLEDSHAQADIILTDISTVDSNTIEQGIANRIRRKEQFARAESRQLTPEERDIDPWTIVIRHMTHEHIPVDPARAIKAKTEKDTKVKTNFPPYKHYYIKNMDISTQERLVVDKEDNPVLDDDGNKQYETVPLYENIEIAEAGRSHWEGGIENGHFTMETGQITNRLALMFMKLVDRYGQRSNWRGYTYLDEMKSQALVQLSQMGLQFDESRSENPFAYYTATITNSFTRVLNIEKRSQNLRDDMLIHTGVAPSHTKQIDHEITEKMAEDLAKKLHDDFVHEDDLEVHIEDHYDEHTRKISAKKDEFKEAVLAHHKHIKMIIENPLTHEKEEMDVDVYDTVDDNDEINESVRYGTD